MGEKFVYTYSVDGIDDKFEFKSNGASDRETGRSWLSEEAAEDFFHNHGGWECRWPIVFHLYEDKAFLGAFSVGVESQPHFYSTMLTA